jgi:ABC-type phosphate/phosphonate transport system substrate-binding protein
MGMEKSAKAKKITEALSTKSGVTVQPRIAKSYPQILTEFTSGPPCLVYVGSFVQSIIRERKIGTPLVQAINGKEFYGSLMVFPKGEDPAKILKEHPAQISFAAGASSGESGAKAATAGKASVRTPNHEATVRAIKAGVAKAGFVKNWWWQANKDKFPEMESHEIAGVSESQNPDNVLSASQAVPPDVREKITQAALNSSEEFGVQKMVRFDEKSLDFSVNLMKKGGIDPMQYSW